MITIKEIRNSFIGKHYSFFDSWGGSQDWILITDVKKRGSNIEIIGLDSWDNTRKRSLSPDIWVDLFESGIHKNVGETIEDWTVTQTYKIVA